MLTPEVWLAAAWGELLDNTIGNQNIQLISLKENSDPLLTIQVAFLNLPTTDLFSAPSQQRLQEGVAWMVDEANSGKGSVYVHCKAGRARSATLVAAYLIQVEQYRTTCFTILSLTTYLSWTICRSTGWGWKRQWQL